MAIQKWWEGKEEVWTREACRKGYTEKQVETLRRKARREMGRAVGRLEGEWEGMWGV